MIYDEPRCAPGGDRFMLIEFGDELSLELNFFSQGLARAAEEQEIQRRGRNGTVFRVADRSL